MTEHIECRSRYRPIEEVLDDVRSRPTVTVADAVVLTDQSETVVRRAISAGDIQVLQIGRNIRVLSAPLRRQLGLD